MPELFDCEHVQFTAKLRDGRRYRWAHRVPSREADRQLGTKRDASEPYVGGEEFARLEAKAYTREGMRFELGEGEEESVPPDMISDLSTEVGRRKFTVAELQLRKVYASEPPNLRVKPPGRAGGESGQ
ncbi:MAG: hypothetical protein WB974_16570 [Acidobacteriaceae bacterium]